MVEVYYNSGQFVNTLPALEEGFADPFTMYERLADYYEDHGYDQVNHTRVARYEILLAFAEEVMPEDSGRIRELLTYDYYLRENAGNRPAFAGETRVSKQQLREFYEREAEEHTYLPGYESYDRNQIRKMTHLEAFEILDQVVLFDYRNRNPLTRQARTVVIAKDR
jgi:hypothetical protein